MQIRRERGGRSPFKKYVWIEHFTATRYYSPMLKTTPESPATFDTLSKFMLSYSVLRAYIKAPLSFLVGTAVRVGGFKKTLPDDVEPEIADALSLQALMYIRLKERVGEEKAFEVMRALLIPASLAVFGAGFRVVESPRTFDNLVDYHQKGAKEGIARFNDIETVERTDSRYEYKTNFCAFYDFFQKAGVPELTHILCDIDYALYNTYLAGDVRFHRHDPDNTLPKGAQCCRFVFEKVKP